MPTLFFPRHDHATIPDGVAAEIQRQIAAGILHAGDRLPAIDRLAHDFGVSLSSVREALTMLKARGVVDVRHGRGSYVRSDSTQRGRDTAWSRAQHDTLQELCEFRNVVALGAARLAAVKATPDDLSELAAALAELRAAIGHLHQVVSWDRAFHDGILRASHNRLFDQGMALPVEVMTEAWDRMHEVPDEVERTVQTHGRILAAIETTDPDAAAVAMSAHLLAVERALGIVVP